MMYGFNEKAVADRKLDNIGPNTGLQLLLNVRQEDQCDATKKYEGDGFRVIIHDSDDFLPLFSMNPSIRIMPGYEISVSLKATQIFRHTAHLGLCQEPMYFRNDKKYYFQNECALQCFQERILKHCSCWSEAAYGTEESFSSSLGVNISSYPVCDISDLKCAVEQKFQTYLSESLIKSCPKCKEPCFQTKYSLT